MPADRFKIHAIGRIEDPSPHVWSTSGTTIVIDGVPHVRCASGVITRDDGSWSPTAADAKRRAADRLDEYAARLTAKAIALRSEADATTRS